MHISNQLECIGIVCDSVCVWSVYILGLLCAALWLAACDTVGCDLVNSGPLAQSLPSSLTHWFQEKRLSATDPGFCPTLDERTHTHTHGGGRTIWSSCSCHGHFWQYRYGDQVRPRQVLSLPCCPPASGVLNATAKSDARSNGLVSSQILSKH